MPGVKSSQHYPAKDAFNAGLIQPLLPLIFLNLFLAVSPGPQLIRPLLGLFMQLLSVLCRLALTSGVMPVNRAISSPNCKFCNTKFSPRLGSYHFRRDRSKGQTHFYIAVCKLPKPDTHAVPKRTFRIIWDHRIGINESTAAAPKRDDKGHHSKGPTSPGNGAILSFAICLSSYRSMASRLQ